MKKTVLCMVAALFAMGLFLTNNVVKAEDKAVDEALANLAESAPNFVDASEK